MGPSKREQFINCLETMENLMSDLAFSKEPNTIQLSILYAMCQSIRLLLIEEIKRIDKGEK